MFRKFSMSVIFSQAFSVDSLHLFQYLDAIGKLRTPNIQCTYIYLRRLLRCVGNLRYNVRIISIEIDASSKTL